MSGAVQIIAEPDGFAVACFQTNCWEHGTYGHSDPWVSAHTKRTDAVRSAKAHREEIRNQGRAQCPTCGAQGERP